MSDARANLDPEDKRFIAETEAAIRAAKGKSWRERYSDAVEAAKQRRQDREIAKLDKLEAERIRQARKDAEAEEKDDDKKKDKPKKAHTARRGPRRIGRYSSYAPTATALVMGPSFSIFDDEPPERKVKTVRVRVDGKVITIKDDPNAAARQTAAPQSTKPVSKTVKAGGVKVSIRERYPKHNDRDDIGGVNSIMRQMVKGMNHTLGQPKSFMMKGGPVLTNDLRQLTDTGFFRDMSQRVSDINKTYSTLDTRLPRGYGEAAPRSKRKSIDNDLISLHGNMRSRRTRGGSYNIFGHYSGDNLLKNAGFGDLLKNYGMSTGDKNRRRSSGFDMGFKMPNINSMIGIPSGSRGGRIGRSKNPFDIDISRMLRY